MRRLQPTFGLVAMTLLAVVGCKTSGSILDETDVDTGSNTAPSAVAGLGGDLVLDTLATLDGTASSDPDGDALTYRWTQFLGTSVTLADSGAASTTFTPTAPVRAGDSLGFELTVCDPHDACSSDRVAYLVVATASSALWVAPPPLGDDASGDGTPSAPYATIAKGVAEGVLALGTDPVQVRIAEGTYDEAITMVEGVSLLGGFDPDAAWVRDPLQTRTVLRSTRSEGLLFDAGIDYTAATEVNGLELRVDPGVTDDDQTTVTVLQGTATLRSCTVVLPNAPTTATGVGVYPAATTADLQLETVSITGGDVSDLDGELFGLDLYGAAGTASATLRDSLVMLTPPQKRTVVGARAVVATVDFERSGIELPRFFNLASLPVDSATGILGLSADVRLTDSTVDGGAGYLAHYGVLASTGGLLTLTDSTVYGGDAEAPTDGFGLSAAIGTGNGVSVVLTRVDAEGGNVPPTSDVNTVHLSVGLYAGDGDDVLIDDSDIDGGGGDAGIGVYAEDVARMIVTNSRINTGGRCTLVKGSRMCIGVQVDGFSGTLASGQLAPQSPDFSCCDRSRFGVVIEDSELRGGEGIVAAALSVDAGSSSGASVCTRGSTLDAGVCDANNPASQCFGVSVEAADDLALFNNVIYGGSGTYTMGVRLQPTASESMVANNYIHGGTPPASGNLTISTGLFLGNGLTNSGPRVVNNIIYGGTGVGRSGVTEENHNADPGRFNNNNVVVPGLPAATPPPGVAYYNNCTPTACGEALTDIGSLATELNNRGQSTLGSGASGNLTDANCMVDPDPLTGDWAQSSTSTCVDAGLERNQSCNICQSPWVDMVGTHRIAQGYDGTCATTSDVLTGDGLPDIGPMEK